MKEYTICICDDEYTIRHRLKEYILSYSFANDIDINTIETDHAHKLMDSPCNYDILFLDIRFTNENIGVDIAEKLRKSGNTSIIVLITSLESMSIDGYRAEPFRFILKPFTQNQINTLLKECLSKLNRSVSYIKIISDSFSELIRTDKITCIYSKARKRHIICNNNETIYTWQTLSELMACLPPDKFSFVQKSYIVNLDMIDTIRCDKITLTNGMVVPLGKHYIDSFIKSFQNNI